MADLTDGKRIYAIGDVHGMRETLGKMLARIRADLMARPHSDPLLICLGDYCDRGPDTKGVYDDLIALETSDLPTTFLLGNHDSYIPAYLRDPDWYDRTYHWLHSAMGGNKTLESYGVIGASDQHPSSTRDAFALAFPKEHMAFLERCLLWKRIGGYVFAHAGIRPKIRMEDQVKDDLIWIRDGFLNVDTDFGFKVVHGHTIVPMVEHHPNRIAVDTGAFRTGVLSCVVLEGEDVSLLEPGGLRPWPEGSGLSRGGIGDVLKSGLKAIWPR